MNYSSCAELDQHVEAYIQHCYDTAPDPIEVPKYYEHAKCAVLALHHFDRFLHGNLPMAWNALRTWWLELPVRMRMPVSEEVVRAVIQVAMLKAFALEQGKWGLSVCFAVGVHFLWTFMARTGELLKLR